MACLDDNTAVEFASGDMPRAATTQVEAHLATCRDCRTLVAALAPAPGDPDSDLATPARPARGKRGLALALASTDARRGSEPRRLAEPVVAVGDTIGRYVVLRRIGAGGMGVVFAAYDPQLDRRVALKLLRTGMGLGEGEARARLVREAQAIAQLSHPHVVAVHDVGAAASGEVYVAMEFVEGDTLTQWLHRWERSWRDVLGVFRDAGLGLAAAHGVGLLHRDFKPDNVLVGSDGRVRVSDFGLARSLVTGADDDRTPTPSPASLRVTLTATGAVMGTPRYMAPEQLRGIDVTAAADQFSFCVALYEALYGAHPIAGDTAAKMVDEGARMRPPPDGKGAPARIASLLARGLDPVPARRFPSMNALLAELAHTAAPPRRRTVAIFGAAALVLGGAAAATVIGPRREADGISPDKQAALEREIAELRNQKQVLIVELGQAAQDGDRATAKIEELAKLLTASDSKIQELQQKLEKAAPPPPLIKPTRVADPGVPLDALRAAVHLIEPDLFGCFTEWDDRPGTEAGQIAVHLRVFPDGRVRNAEPRGLDDTVARVCVSLAARRLVLPRSEVVTVFELDARYAERRLTVTVTRQGTEAAPLLIDNPGQ